MFVYGVGSLFGVSALTFGKWQVASGLGAVVFRTIGGPTLLSSVLRTPGMPPFAVYTSYECSYTFNVLMQSHISYPKHVQA